MKPLHVVPLFAAVLIVACTTTGRSTRLTDPEVAMVLHVANLSAVREGEVARQKAADPTVRDFAQTIINEHMATNNKAEADLARANISSDDSGLSRQIDANSGKAADALRAATGRAFDRAYVDRQIEFDRYLLGIIDSQLVPSARHRVVRNAITEFRGLVDKQLVRAQQIASSLPR
jgi:putative membrane protein